MTKNLFFIAALSLPFTAHAARPSYLTKGSSTDSAVQAKKNAIASARSHCQTIYHDMQPKIISAWSSKITNEYFPGHEVCHGPFDDQICYETPGEWRDVYSVQARFTCRGPNG